MIDIDNADQILQGADTHADILQALGLVLLDEVKRLRGEPEVNKCPTCGSRDITIYDSFVDSGAHKVRCEGDGCESRWFEIWRHVGIEMIEGEDNR